MRVLTPIEYEVLTLPPLARADHVPDSVINAMEARGHLYRRDYDWASWQMLPTDRGKLAVRCHEALMRSISGMGG